MAECIICESEHAILYPIKIVGTMKRKHICEECVKLVKEMTI